MTTSQRVHVGKCDNRKRPECIVVYRIGRYFTKLSDSKVTEFITKE